MNMLSTDSPALQAISVRLFATAQRRAQLQEKYKEYRHDPMRRASYLTYLERAIVECEDSILRWSCFFTPKIEGELHV